MNAGRLTFLPKGAYAATETYDRLDIVRYNGDSYLCKKLCIGITPADGEFWMQLTNADNVESRLSTLEGSVVSNAYRNSLPFENRTVQSGTWVCIGAITAPAGKHLHLDACVRWAANNSGVRMVRLGKTQADPGGTSDSVEAYTVNSTFAMGAVGEDNYTWTNVHAVVSAGSTVYLWVRQTSGSNVACATRLSGIYVPG